MPDAPQAPPRTNDYSEANPPAQYEIVQANERVPHWFRCLVVVDEIKGWGVQGYTTIPHPQRPPGDAYIRLNLGRDRKDRRVHPLHCEGGRR